MNMFDKLELPDGAVEVTASATNVSQKAEETGTSAGVKKESEPAPLSSDSPSDMDARIDEAYHKATILGKIEPLLNGLFNRLNKIIEIANGIKQIAGSTVARYLVTDQQVKRFEADLLKHFDDALQKKAQKEFQKYVFDLEHTRNEAVQKFNQELKNGWWFSNKVGWFLYMSNIITLLGAALFCYFK